MKLGAHMSTSGGVWKALERGHGIGCEVVQIFVKNNMQWFGRPFLPTEVELYTQQSALCEFSCVFGHTGYLINLGAAPSANRDNSIKSLIQEIQLAANLKIPFLVLHPGAHLGAGDACGLEQIVAGLDEVCRTTKDTGVRIALENTAGQGSCLGHRMEHLAAIFESVKNAERLAVCIDTAHLFAAGYDIRTSRGWDGVISTIDETIGLKQIVAFHLNDSKTDLGSRVDRHEHIGQGKIGREAFKHIVGDARFKNHPGCLETPKTKDLHEDVQNLTVLRSLRGSEKRPIRARKRSQSRAQ